MKFTRLYSIQLCYTCHLKTCVKIYAIKTCASSKISCTQLPLQFIFSKFLNNIDGIIPAFSAGNIFVFILYKQTLLYRLI